LTIIIENRDVCINIRKNTVFSIFNTQCYLNPHLLPVTYPHNVLSNPGTHRQMRFRHSCLLENVKVSNKMVANRPMQRRVLGPVKKVCRCHSPRFCGRSQNERRQVGPVSEKISVAGTPTSRRLMHLGAYDSIPGVVANTAPRATSDFRKKKKGTFRVCRRVRARAFWHCHERHSVTI
jgi:hypothetical protein